MLHETRINFRRRIVNQTRRFSCRAAAQFNPGIEVLRRDYGGGKEEEWWVCSEGLLGSAANGQRDTNA
jgi:hypothetical protein